MPNELTQQEQDDINELLKRDFVAGPGFSYEDELPEPDITEEPEEPGL